MIEFLKGGSAKIIPELAHLEPIDTGALIAALRRKTGVDHGTEFEPWYRWFTEDYANEHDRETLRIMRRLYEAQKTYVERITKKRGMKPDSK
jgi:hypothetical protein